MGFALDTKILNVSRMKPPSMSCPPQWIQDLTRAVAEHIYSFDVLSPVGCHFYKVESQWEVTIFASSTEVVGGPKDGMRTSSNFSLDLYKVHKVLDDVSEFRWQPLSLGDEDELGPHISLEGTREGHEIWLRILSEAPADIEPGRIIWAYDGRMEQVWK